MYTHEVGRSNETPKAQNLQKKKKKKNNTQNPSNVKGMGEGEGREEEGEGRKKGEPERPPRVGGRSRGRGTPSLT